MGWIAKRGPFVPQILAGLNHLSWNTYLVVSSVLDSNKDKRILTCLRVYLRAWRWRGDRKSRKPTTQFQLPGAVVNLEYQRNRLLGVPDPFLPRSLNQSRLPCLPSRLVGKEERMTMLRRDSQSGGAKLVSASKSITLLLSKRVFFDVQAV